MMNKYQEKLMSFIGVPEEVALDLPTIIITGNKKIEIDNYKNVVKYTLEHLKINTTSGLIVITGNELFIREVEFGHICVTGHISNIEFINAN